MKIRLCLKKHCIRTGIKRLYNLSISKYFKQGHDKDAFEGKNLDTKNLEGEIRLLKTALETLDFNRLRSEYPKLAGHNDARVFLSKDENGCLEITIDGNPCESIMS